MAIKTWQAPWLHLKVPVVCSTPDCSKYLDGAVINSYLVKWSDLDQFYEDWANCQNDEDYCPVCGVLGLMEEPESLGRY